jgi:phage-related protein
MARLMQQHARPIALALADRLQKPGIPHRAQQARGIALGHVQQRNQIRHRHVVTRVGEATKHVSCREQDGHVGLIQKVP